jgi:hypothetical protein
VETARLIAAQIANATFAARQTWLWGEGSTAVASDSTHFSAFDQNIFTEWHSRYGGRGVLIYWHIETGAVAVHSRLISRSASEVAAMIGEDSGHRQVPDARLTGRLNFCAHSGTAPEETTRPDLPQARNQRAQPGGAQRAAKRLPGVAGRCWCSSRRSMRPNGTAASPRLCCLPWWLAGRLVSGMVCLAAIRGRDFAQQQRPGSPG